VKLLLEIDQQLEVVIGAIAHGGHCVARHDGQVIFVRHALPGERAVVVITSLAKNFARADVVRIIEPSADRVIPPCKYAGECGGCDFQHVSISAQRALKADVIEEQFKRLAKIDLRPEVEEVPNEFDSAGRGLHWRTRMSFKADSKGRLGLRRNHSYDIIPIDECLISVPGLIDDADNSDNDVLVKRWPPNSTVQVTIGNLGDRSSVVTQNSGTDEAMREVVGRQKVRQKVLGRTFEVAADGFWQVHPGAPVTLSRAVIDCLSPKAGEIGVDLYAGSGLFTGALLSELGSTGLIHLVESSTSGTADAKAVFGRSTNVKIHRGEALAVLRDLASEGSIDFAVLDPPRSGAGLKVLTAVATLEPRRLAYVACDPAALARDTAYLRDLGYSLRQVRAFDLFPMTHHVECVALFEICT